METDITSKFVVIDLNDLRETPDDIKDIINNADVVLFRDNDNKHIILKNSY